MFSTEQFQIGKRMAKKSAFCPFFLDFCLKFSEPRQNNEGDTVSPARCPSQAVLRTVAPIPQPPTCESVEYDISIYAYTYILMFPYKPSF